MPELPEVETTRRGIEPWCQGQQVSAFNLWQGSLRWPVPEAIGRLLPSRQIQAVRRRGKYLLLDAGCDSLILHLGMSGSLRVCKPDSPRRKHDHWQMILGNGFCLRYHDPRRFGALLWHPTVELDNHPLLRVLGIEPLAGDFDGAYLFERSRGRSLAVKNFIMDSHLVVGVGNIYAAEALFLAGIDPTRQAGRVALTRYQKLATSIVKVLNMAIDSGGTTLRDYVNGSGNPGYFAQQLRVYGRSGEPCPHCGSPIRNRRLGQRSSFYCPRCQR